jgi:hypothetical protein
LLFFTLSFSSFIDGLDSSVANASADALPQQLDTAANSVESCSQPAVQGVTAGGTSADSSVDEEDIASDIKELEEVFSELVMPFISSQANSQVTTFVISQTETNYRRIREDPSEFIYGSLEYITAFLLLMMPLMAVIQATMDMGSKRY